MSAPIKPLPPEPEAIASPRVTGILLVTLAVFAASTVIVLFLERGWTHGRSDFRNPDVPAQLEQQKINLLEQVPFSSGPRAAPLQDAQRFELTHYGWTDRPRGLAREPVDVAMAELVKEAGAK